MFISDFAIKRPIVTVVVMVALVIFGIFAAFKTDVDELPDIQAPIVFVGVPYPGASPDQVEHEVVDRMEDAFQGLNGIDQITSTSMDGFAQIVVQFVYSKNTDQASQDVRDAISGIRDKLPVEMKEPIIKKFDPSDQPIVSLTLTSNTLSPNELTILADPGITRQLQGVSGVAQVTVSGGAARDISVNVVPNRMAAAKVSVSDVVNALNSQNLAVPVGMITGPLEERSIRLRGRFEHAADFAQLVVAQRGGQLVRLGDVASVSDGSVEQRSLALFNGEPGIGIDVTKSKGSSTTSVSDGVLAQVKEIEKTLPAGVKLNVVRDAGSRVRASVRNVEEALVEGAILTVLVVFLFLNSWRSTVITGLALPVSTISAFIAVWAFGFTLNTMSLLGLSLAIGILIDDAIVVRENIVRHVELGEDHFKAAHTGTDEIGLAVTATTFSIMAVFLPVAFMNDLSGQWFKPFALTIACAVLVSLFVSFSLDPMLSAYWPDPAIEEGEHRGWISHKLEMFNKWFDRQADRYMGVIAWALDHRADMVAIAVGAFFAAIMIPVKGMLAALLVLGAVLLAVWIMSLSLPVWLKAPAIIAGFVVALVLSGVVPTVGKLGGGFVPDSDNSELTIAIEAPPGSSLDYTHIKSEEVARIARSHKEVAYTYTTVGSASGSGAVDAASIYVKLVPKKDRSLSQGAIGAAIRREIARVGGVTAYTYNAGFAGNQKQIQVQVHGNDATELARVAEQMQAIVRKVPGAADVGLSTKGLKPELDVQLNRGLAGTLGITVGQLAQALRPAFAGIQAGNWVDPTGKTRDVTVRLAPQARNQVADIEQLPITVSGAQAAAASGAQGAATPMNTGPQTVPLSQIATINNTTGPAQIDHLNEDKVVTVGANVGLGYALSDVSAAVNKAIAQVPLPPGVGISQGGQVKDQGKVFGAIFGALGLAVLLMYLILVMQFGSFLDPLAIMLSLPLSLIGVVLALVITGDTLNIMSLIGVILLMGIVAKNAILLVDFAKWTRESKQVPLRDALIEAGRVRLRPILMTTLALIAGMIPVALGLGEGADFRAPLGRAVIGGVITSTLLTLLVIPTFYEILDDWRESVLHAFGRQKQETPAPHGEPAHDGKKGGAAPVPALGEPTP
ncbi:MAG TPA: efflux RND transporter permease subunit [Candidatus Elarobacter sp.]|nr:efflux RND transporter permease subunit [Candidatus Elarobacter sp.]